jgi:hypothetical protein
MRITRIALSAVIMLVGVAAVYGQDRRPLTRDEEGRYLVSARAGVVSVVDGEATFKRGRADWEALSEGDELRPGDTVRTGVDGRLEVLLSPGSFFRLSEDSEFVFTSTSVYNLRLRIVKGSAIIEASAVDSPISVSCGQNQFHIVKNGLFRFSVDSSGKVEALVRKGRLTYAGKTVKDGKKVVVDAGAPVVLAFDKKVEDGFDLWSRQRAQAVVAANRKLSSRAMRMSLSMWTGNLWIWDPFCRCYTFLPFGAGFSSPYGWGYRVGNPYYNPWYYNPNYGHVGGGGGSTGASGGGTGGSVGGSTGGGGGSSRPGSGVGGTPGGASGGGLPANRPTDTSKSGRPNMN